MAWVWGHVLEHRKPTSGHTLNKQLFSLPSGYKLPLAPRHRVGPGKHLPISTRIWARKLLILMKYDLLIFFFHGIAFCPKNKTRKQKTFA